MTRVFIDSSVLFSAAFSSQGASREIMMLAIREEVTLVVSNYVLEETKRNLARKVPQALEILEFIISQVPFEVVNPAKREVITAAQYIELKDAPIVAAGKKAKVEFLVTLDRKHLLGNTQAAEYGRFYIVNPEVALSDLRKTN